MSQNPYQNLPAASFWSSGVSSPVKAGSALAIEPLLGSFSKESTIVSGGSCFSQYVGGELAARGYRYLRSVLSDGRVESFGLGNIYSVAQFRQWLEFSLGERRWSDDTVFEQDGACVDYLLPHRRGESSRERLIEYRDEAGREIVDHLRAADVLVFTAGLTETWRTASGDVLPSCPGASIGQFDEASHRFLNCTFEDVLSDLHAVDDMLARINPSLKTVLTVSPVPLTATAGGDHVLVATSHSKSILRAAVGEFCRRSSRASYFPSYELINHHAKSDWRLEENLRSISPAGVGYVMAHAFGGGKVPRPPLGEASLSRGPGGTRTHALGGEEAICEEEKLDAYAKRGAAAGTCADSAIFLIGDSHMQRLANGLGEIGVRTIGGQVMNGSGFSDNKFELSDETIFVPLENDESREIWESIVERLRAATRPPRIVTNIGFQTHRTIAGLSNHLGSPILTAANVSDYFDSHCTRHIGVLRELGELGDVWLLEDPNFYPLLGSSDGTTVVCAKNFPTYCAQLRRIGTELGIRYLDPCDAVLQRYFGEFGDVGGLIEADGCHGTDLYYEHCAREVAASIGADRADG